MTDDKDSKDSRWSWIDEPDIETTWKVEGPFSLFRGNGNKIKLGATVHRAHLEFMDAWIQKGYFATRSDFISLSILYFLMKSGDFSKLIQKINQCIEVSGAKVEIPSPHGRKKKIGFTGSPFLVILMDAGIKEGLFLNRSAFITDALKEFIDFLKSEDTEKLLSLDVDTFYARLFHD